MADFIEDLYKIKAADLRDKFSFYGAFYNRLSLTDQGAQRDACRLVLDMVKGKYQKGLVVAENPVPDLVVVMMNPGGSRPILQEEAHLEHHVCVPSGELLDMNSLALLNTLPDRTQYQVLKLATYAGLSHVRVLNLSDLRCPQSSVFVSMVQQRELYDASQGHSLFSLVRQSELDFLAPMHVPVLLAWGKNPKLERLQKLALQRLKGRSFFGLEDLSKCWRYAHPLPQTAQGQKDWLLSMVNAWDVLIGSQRVI